MSDSSSGERSRLRAVLARYDGLMVAYSGGVDSAYLAWEASQVLGEHMLAVIADSPSLPRAELNAATSFAQEHGIPLRVVQTHEMRHAEYVRNDGQRCFHCKDELFSVMEDLRASLGFAHLAYGRNLDDDGDFRPGQRAAAQHHVLAPLAEAGLRKADVRALAREAGLIVWEKTASACLASRLEYGRPVTIEALRQVELAETALHALGFRQCRVRHHGDVARIEIAENEWAAALTPAMMARLNAAVRTAGFLFAALDTEPYRSGSMNAALVLLDAVAPAAKVGHAT